MDEETSESGAPIYRHEASDSPRTPPEEEAPELEAISDHIERHIGKIDMVWHEIVSDLVHIDVHQVAPTDDRPYWTLVTSGMSDLPMKTPEGREEFAFAELMMCLPPEWRLNREDFKDEAWYWPIRSLKMLARFPHKYRTWLWMGHTVPNGDPAEPYAPGVPFTCMMLWPAATVSTEFWELPVDCGKTIRFLALYPLYPGEVDLKLKTGTKELIPLFERYKITELVNLNRRDVSK